MRGGLWLGVYFQDPGGGSSDSAKTSEWALLMCQVGTPYSVLCSPYHRPILCWVLMDGRLLRTLCVNHEAKVSTAVRSISRTMCTYECQCTMERGRRKGHMSSAYFTYFRPISTEYLGTYLYGPAQRTRGVVAVGGTHKPLLLTRSPNPRYLTSPSLP